MEELASCLASIQSVEAGVRRSGEAWLAQASTQPGFAPALLSLALASPLDSASSRGSAQLAMVLLRRHVKKHWVRDDEDSDVFEVSEADKATLRWDLPRTLVSADAGVRSAGAACVAAVASWDCPERWPELLPGLFQSIASNSAHAQGAVHCLSLFVEDVSSEDLNRLGPELMTSLMRLLHTLAPPQAWLVAAALRLSASVVQSMQLYARSDPTARHFLDRAADAWLPLCDEVLSDRCRSRLVWDAQLAAAKLLQAFVAISRRRAAPQVLSAVATAWKLQADLAQAREESCVLGGGEDSDGESDLDEQDNDENQSGLRPSVFAPPSDEATLSLDSSASVASLTEQLLELSLCLADSRPLRAAVSDSLAPCLALAARLAQLSRARRARLLRRPQEALEAGVETQLGAARELSEALADRLVETLGLEALQALLGAVGDALTGRGAEPGSEAWWVRREAALGLLGASLGSVWGLIPGPSDEAGFADPAPWHAFAAGDRVSWTGAKGGAPAARQQLRQARSVWQSFLGALCSDLGRWELRPCAEVQPSLVPPPFAVARALRLLGALGLSLPPSRLPPALDSLLQGPLAHAHALVRVEAGEAAAALVASLVKAGAGSSPDPGPSFLHQSTRLLEALGAALERALRSSERESALASLRDASRVFRELSEDRHASRLQTSPAAAALRAACDAQGPALAALALEVWGAHVLDPGLATRAAELVREVAGRPACLGAVLARAAGPLLGAVESGAREHGAGGEDATRSLACAVALRLLADLLDRCRGEDGTAGELARAARAPALALARGAADDALAGAAVRFLGVALGRAGWAALAEGVEGGGEALLDELLEAVRASLAPRWNGDVGADLAHNLLALCPAPLLQPRLRPLAVVVASAVCSWPGMSSWLLPLLARLMLASGDAVVDALAGGGRAPAEVWMLKTGAPVRPRTLLQGTMEVWMHRQMEVCAPARIALTLRGMGALLHCEHPAIDGLLVRGIRLDAGEGGGPRTRSRARQRPDRWSRVPLKAKVAMMLVDAYIEDAVQKEPSEDGEWEDASSEDEDEGGEEAQDGGPGEARIVSGTEEGEGDEGDEDDEEAGAQRIWQEIDSAAAKLDVAPFVKECFAFSSQHLPQEMALVDAQLSDYQRQWLGKLLNN